MPSLTPKSWNISRRNIMLNHTSRPTYASALLLFSTLLASSIVNAACGCPDDGHGAPKAASGLGQSSPQAVDLAPDPSWQVYEFERDGIRYTQVNDRNGIVRAAAGRISDTFWVMPIGVDADRVAVPGDAVPAGQPRVLVKLDEVEVVLYQDGSRQHWLIRLPATAK
jgi:hypothetical protein